MQKEYKTIRQSAEAEVEEKKSKFIASVKPIQREEEAIGFINTLKSKYWDASHNVYAYLLCGETTIQRYSDDGEPSGTAGMPIVEVIKRTGVQDLVVVVTRYFGGTLLGAAGLIRAYGKSAALGIEAAGVIKRQLCIEMQVICEYSLLGKIQNLIYAEGWTLKQILYEQDVEITVFVPIEEDMRFTEMIVELTNARALVEPGEKTYISIGQDGKILTDHE